MSKFWGFFYLGFPAKFGGFRKNWDFHTFRLAWFLKGFPAKFWGFRKILDFYTCRLAWILKGFPAKFRGFRKIWDFHTFHLAWFLKGFQAPSAREARRERRSREKPRSGKYGSHVHFSRVHPSLQCFQPSVRVDPLLSGCEVKWSEVSEVKWSEVSVWVKWIQKGSSNRMKVIYLVA